MEIKIIHEMVGGGWMDLLPVESIPYVLDYSDEHYFKPYERLISADEKDRDYHDYLLCNDFYQNITLLIPGFWDKEIQEMNKGQIPVFPELLSDEFKIRIIAALEELKRCQELKGAPAYFFPKLSESGRALLLNLYDRIIQTKQLYNDQLYIAESKGHIFLDSDGQERPIEGYHTFTCCEDHKRAQEIYSELEDLGFKIALFMPGYSQYYRYDLSYIDVGGTPRVLNPLYGEGSDLLLDLVNHLRIKSL